MNSFASFEELLEVVRKEKPKEGFSCVASNPPYQEDTSGTRDSNVYHHFMNVAKSISELASFIYPSKWMTGAGVGEGLDEFANEELSSNNYRIIYDYPNSAGFFNVEINGGIMYFLWDSKKKDPKTNYFFNGEKFERELTGFKSFVRDPKSCSIVDKIDVGSNLMDVASFRSPYGEIVNNYALAKLQEVPKSLNTVDIYCIVKPGAEPGLVTVDRSILKKTPSDWRVLVSVTAHPMLHKHKARQDRILLAGPGQGCSGQFIEIESFANQNEALNLLRYLKTDFCGFLFALRTSTHHAKSKSYRLIPNVNFATGEIHDKPGSFLDFSSPTTLDDQLANIYNLSQDERDLMADGLKPWKDRLSPTSDM